MSWRERTVIAILLLVARILCDDDVVSARIATLATDVQVNGK